MIAPPFVAAVRLCPNLLAGGMESDHVITPRQHEGHCEQWP